MQKVFSQILLLVVLLSIILVQQASATDSKTAQAIKASEDFLLLVDTSQYSQSWDSASSFFKSQVSKENWVKQISGLRPAFGKVIDRQILGIQNVTELPGAPDGEYMVIQYNTSFEDKRKAVETITPMLDTDGKWHVSGYYIQ